MQTANVATCDYSASDMCCIIWTFKPFLVRQRGCKSAHASTSTMTASENTVYAAVRPRDLFTHTLINYSVTAASSGVGRVCTYAHCTSAYAGRRWRRETCQAARRRRRRHSHCLLQQLSTRRRGHGSSGCTHTHTEREGGVMLIV